MRPTASIASGSPLYGPDHAEREYRAAVVVPDRIAPEGGVGDDPQLGRADAERLERAAAALAVGDDAVEAAEEPLPGPRVARRPAREQIVRREDERAARVEQQPVGLGRCDPLQVKQVAVGEAEPGKRQRMLERLHREPGA